LERGIGVGCRQTTQVLKHEVERAAVLPGAVERRRRASGIRAGRLVPRANAKPDDGQDGPRSTRWRTACLKPPLPATSVGSRSARRRSCGRPGRHHHGTAPRTLEPGRLPRSSFVSGWWGRSATICNPVRGDHLVEHAAAGRSEGL